MPDNNFWKGKRVFLTGHTGFKGAWLSSLLLDAGADITGYSLAPCTGESLFNLLNLSRQISSVIGDIRNLDTLKKVFLNANPEIIFHLAAQPLVTESYHNPVYTYETNVMGTVNILECARIYGTARSIVNVTTDKVYLNKEWHWGYRENDRLCGHDPYSNSKSCSELATRSYIDSFFYAAEAAAISTARSGNVIGGGDFSPGRIIPDCVRAAHKHQTIAVRNPDSTRPYQHVLECLHGYMLLAQKQYEDKNKYAGSYNFGPNDACCITTGELVSLFCRKWGSGQTWESAGIDGPHEASLLKLDCSRARAALGWKPVWTIDDALDKAVEWYRSWEHREDMAKLTSRQIHSFLSNA